MLGMAMMIPSLTFQQPGSAPSGGNLQQGSASSGNLSPGSSVPQVGGIGGGGLPSDSGISTISLSLALVPLGLMAVAVFPPFERFVESFDLKSESKKIRHFQKLKIV